MKLRSTVQKANPKKQRIKILNTKKILRHETTIKKIIKKNKDSSQPMLIH